MTCEKGGKVVAQCTEMSPGTMRRPQKAMVASSRPKGGLAGDVLAGSCCETSWRGGLRALQEEWGRVRRSQRVRQRRLG